MSLASLSDTEQRLSLTDRLIVIIGGSSGIGFGVAKLAVAEGARVVVSASTAEKLQTTLDRLKSSRASGQVLDVRSDESIAAFFAPLNDIDHIVYTAGDSLYVSKPDFDVRSSRGAFDVRYFGMLDAVRHALPKLHSHYASSITLTSSIAPRRVSPGLILAAGVTSATESAARYLAKQCAPIRVNVVAPGAVLTELWDKHMSKEQRDARLANDTEKLPVKHVASADELAEAYLFCWRCAYITGQTINVDGGALLL